MSFASFHGDPELEHLASPAAFERWLEPLEKGPWIIRCREVSNPRRANPGPDETMKVIEYLANNYANRIALSDSRILDMDGDRVLLKYKDYRDGDQQKTVWIEGVELIRKFLRHLLPPGMHHTGRCGWLGRRAKQEKLDYLRRYHGLAAAEPDTPPGKEDEAEGESQEQVRTRTCRFCPGTMHRTRSKFRPTVSEVMEMPLDRFRQAQAGVRVTLGPQFMQMEVEGSGNDAPPAARDMAEETRRRLSSLLTSGYL